MSKPEETKTADKPQVTFQSLRDTTPPDKRVELKTIRSEEIPTVGHVERNVLWEARWSHEKMLAGRLAQGWRFVTSDCVVTHFEPLGQWEFRINGPWREDVAGRVQNMEGMYLIVVPKWRHEEIQRGNVGRLRKQAEAVVRGNPDQDFSHLKPEAREQIEAKTQLVGDSIA